MKFILGAAAILGAGWLAWWYLNRPGGAGQAAANAGQPGVNPPVGGAPGPSICQSLVTVGGAAVGTYYGQPTVGAGAGALIARPLCQMGPIAGKIASGIKSAASATAHAIGFGATATVEATTKATIAAAKASGLDQAFGAVGAAATLKPGTALTKANNALTTAAFAPLKAEVALVTVPTKVVASFTPKPVKAAVNTTVDATKAVANKAVGLAEGAAKTTGNAAKKVLCLGFC